MHTVRRIPFFVSLGIPSGFPKLHGRMLTPDGLCVICDGLDNVRERIGIRMLEIPARFRDEEIME